MINTKIKVFALYLSSIIFSGLSFAQWSELILPERSIPISECTYPSGDDCMIFAVDTSNIIYGFDQNSKVWSEYSATTTLDWETGYGGGKVCIVLNDSVAVAYSSVLSQFKELRFDGTLLSLPGSGWTSCGDYYGVVMTTERIYIYDAQANDWKSVAMVDYTQMSGYGNNIHDDYMYIMMSFSNFNTRLVAYSLHTKTFAEITKYNFSVTNMDHGLCGLEYSSSSYITGYSAYTGSFSEVSLGDPGIFFERSVADTDTEKVSELILCMFYKRSALDGDGNVILTVYMFNSVTGEFYSDAYTYRYATTGIYTKVGGKFSVLAIYDESNYKVNLYIFRASNNSFYSLDVPIHIIALTPGLLTVGEEVFWIWDDTHLIAVNATTGETGQINFNDSFTVLPPQEVNMAGDDWGVWAYRNTGSDTVKIFYFSGDVTNIGYKEECASLGVTQVQYDKIGCIMFQSAGNLKKWSVFSPTHNAWHDFESTTSSSDYQTVPGNYMYVNYTTKSRLELFDAVTNEVKIYPPVTSYTYSISEKDHLTVFNSAIQYVGYSAVQHDDQMYQSDKYYGLTGTDNIVVLSPSGALLNTYTKIIYDGYRNNFAGLRIADSLGTSMNGRQSGKFCFYATATGHVFAYTGESGNVVSVKQNSNYRPAEYSLSQNYPNPFNPTTTIHYSLQKPSRITIKIYNVMGQEVARLVDDHQKSGEYKVQWNAEGCASGIYFCRFMADYSVAVRKLLLIK